MVRRPGFAAACLSLVLLLGAIAPAARAANEVTAENALAGDSYWTAATEDPGNGAIQGYASATSVRAGGLITFQVSTSPAATYRIEISRLGWYRGAGGRRIACLVGSQLDPSCTLDHHGVQQPNAPPPDPVTGELNAGWSTTDTLTVPPGWTSGYYLAVFRLTSGPSAGTTGFTPFIVQAPAGDHSAILVQVPTNTWQAYNSWGGEGFYSKPVRAVKESFDRPYDHRLLFDWEYPLIRFLERGGWDVTYATDDDVDADPSILLDHTLDMVAGHDEYWTKIMRDGWEAAREAGVNLAFMGANTGYWQVRYEDNRRTLVGYKYSPDPEPDPALKTTLFRWLIPARPECELQGVEFQNVVLYHRNIDATADPAVAQDPWLAGTSLEPGAVLSGLGGSETDAVTPACHVPPVTRLLTYAGPPMPNGTPAIGDAVRYTACSGAEVFSAGSLQFSWGLDSWRDPSYTGPGLPPLPPDDPRLQRAMTNGLADLTRSHVPVPGPPHICVPTAGIAAPAAWVATGQRIQLSSTASDQYGSISGQTWAISLDGQSASARATSLSRTFWRPGTAHVSLVVADSSGATATATRSLEVCPCPAPGRRGAVLWPPGSQHGPPCELGAIGSLSAAPGQLWFAPTGAVSRYVLTAYRVAVRGAQSRLVRLSQRSVTGSAAPVAIPAVRAAMIIDVSFRGRRRVWHQRFLVPFAAGRTLAAPGQLDEAMCDGTSANVLTPIFGVRAPLRVAVTGPGRVLVTVTGPRGIFYRQVVAARGGTIVVPLGRNRVARGVYRITVARRYSRLPEPVRLVALAL